MHTIKIAILAVAATGSLPSAALAMDMSGMDMSAKPASAPAKAAPSDSMPGMDMKGMSAPTQATPAPAYTAPGTSMQGMDMNAMPGMSMPASSSAAGPDAGTANSDSGGYTLTTGPYIPAGVRPLRMADQESFGSVLVDRLERAYSRDSGNWTAYDLQAWYGGDFNRAVLKAEGQASRGRLHDARTELLWGHAIASYWDLQTGVRHDSGGGPDRNWMALGVQGLAPYWFGVEATAYVGDQGRSALRLASSYELLLTQRWVLQPRAEVNMYGKDDPERKLGSGLSDATAGLRLRYEFSRQFGPYVGVEWSGRFGRTADLARMAGERTSTTNVVAGLHFWF